jgi:hypothetical protein
MTTEAQRTYMRDYMKRRRAAGLDSSRLPTDRPRRNARTLTPPPPLSGTKLERALSAYSRSIGALERSKYLDALIRGEKPDQEAKPLARPQAVDQMTEAQRRVQYRAELAPLIAAVDATFDSLPDLVSMQDVLDRLDPVLVAALQTRALLAVAKVLKRRGAMPRDAGNSNDGTFVRIYVVRRAEHYASVRGRGLFAAYEAVKAGRQPPAVSGRASKAKVEAHTPGRRPAHHGPSMGQGEALS